MTRPWPCTGCGSALGEVTDTGRVEVDSMMVRVILDRDGSHIVCVACRKRRLWRNPPDAAWSVEITVGTTTVGG